MQQIFLYLQENEKIIALNQRNNVENPDIITIHIYCKSTRVLLRPCQKPPNTITPPQPNRSRASIHVLVKSSP